MAGTQEAARTPGTQHAQDIAAAANAHKRPKNLSLDPLTIHRIERLRGADVLFDAFGGRFPTQSEVVVEAVRRLAEDLQVRT
jgi:hypothetical protein